MVTKVQKWGNSLGLRLPKKLADDLNMATGTEVDIVVHEGKLVLTPRHPKRFTLDELLSRVTKRNKHSEVDLGPGRGDEQW